MRAHLGLWRELFVLCLRRRPGLTALVLACQLTNMFAFAGLGIALRAAVNGIVGGDTTAIVAGSVGAALAYTAETAIGDTGYALRIALVEQIGLTEVEPGIMRMVGGIEEIDHLERTEFLDRITAVRGQAWGIVDSAWAALESVSLALRLAVTLALLGSVSPWLLLLLVCAAAQLWLDRYGRAGKRRAEIEVAEDIRLQRHLFETCTSAGPGKELRVAGVGEELVRRQVEAWQRATAVRARAGFAAAWWSTAGWTVFSAGFTLALAVVVSGGTVGDMVLAVTVGSQLRMVVELTVRRSTDAGSYGRILEPYLWLRAYAAERAARRGPGLPPPARLREGLALEDVTFRYPGGERPAVEGVSVRIPAGSVVAVVGEYGSGKTTLVKLLAKMYRPESGRILVDGTDLAAVDTAAWRAAMSAAFQDFGRYQTSFGQAVGLGDLERMDDEDAVAAAVGAADAEPLRARLPEGAATQLGRRFGGLELSEGQWQKVALARACMRAEPLLFVLDEPTASLDAPSEHAIFERYMTRSRDIAAATGAVTVIVSHRFSTVAGADLILVMERGRLVEAGTHEELAGLEGGVYAALYGIQATAYAAGGR